MKIEMQFTNVEAIALLLCVSISSIVIVAAEDLNLLILHNNDMHSRFQETSRTSGTCAKPGSDKCYGGFARTAHVIREARNEAADTDREVLYLNAGDTYTGTSWFTVHGWKIAADFLNALKPDAMSFGNHEFDRGIDGLVPFLEAVRFPVVAANLDYTLEPKLDRLRIPKSVVLNVRGRKVGVIGYLTNETKIISSSGEVIFLDEVASIRKESQLLDAQGVKIIIALGHSGFVKDKEIAKNVPLVDVVIGGHTNTFLWNGKQPDVEYVEGLYPTEIVQPSGKKVPVVQAYAYTKYMGRLNVTFDDYGELTRYEGLPLLLSSAVPQDKDILDMVEHYAPEIRELVRRVVGKSKVTLDSTQHFCRKMECNFGNLITDAFVAYRASTYAGQYWTDTPIGLMNGGGIRMDVEPQKHGGNITRGDLLGSNPFDCQIISMNLTGKQLLDTLEIGVRSDGETSYGEFLQVSGLQVTYDLTKPKYTRVVSVLARCAQCDIPVYEPVNVHKSYRVIANSFLANGGDGHHVLKYNGTNKIVEDLNDVDVLSWYLNTFSPVTPEISGRITIMLQKDQDMHSSTDRVMIRSSVIVIMFVTLVRYL